VSAGLTQPIWSLALMMLIKNLGRHSLLLRCRGVGMQEGAGARAKSGWGGKAVLRARQAAHRRIARVHVGRVGHWGTKSTPNEPAAARHGRDASFRACLGRIEFKHG
jgi:hypothetical protein